MSACFGAAKKAIFSVLMLMGEGGVVVGWFANAVVLLRLRNGRAGEERLVAFLQFMEVAAPLHAVEKSLGCTCLRRSTPDEFDHGFFGKELEHRVVKIEELYGIASLSFIVRRANLARSNEAVHAFKKELPWS